MNAFTQLRENTEQIDQTLAQIKHFYTPTQISVEISLLFLANNNHGDTMGLCVWITWDLLTGIKKKVNMK